MLFLIPSAGALSRIDLEGLLRKISSADRTLTVNMVPHYLGRIIAEHEPEGVLLYRNSSFDRAVKAALTRYPAIQIICIQPLNGIVNSYGVYGLVKGEMRISMYPVIPSWTR